MHTATVVRVEKKGAAVTFYIGTEKQGAFVPDFPKTVDNVHLCICAGHYKQLRINASAED